MGYFPFFQNIEDVQIIVVGGGKVAYGKVKRLLPYDPLITVIAPEICDAINELCVSEPRVKRMEKEIALSDLEEAAVVIAATDNAALNHEISLFCRERKIPVNAVDCAEDCTFIFPALIRQGKLSVGISTEGASPKMAAYLKDQIKEVIPENVEGKLDFLNAIRPLVREHIADEEARAAFYQEILGPVVRGELAFAEQIQELLVSRD